MKNRSTFGVVQARRATRKAFTLIELLLVLVILAVLAGIVIPKLTGRAEQARVAAAKADIASIKSALNNYELDNGKFPETLTALIEKPGDLASWKGPYLEKMPKDPWTHDYVYRCPGNGGKDFDLVSTGPDGSEGSADDVEP